MTPAAARPPAAPAAQPAQEAASPAAAPAAPPKLASASSAHAPAEAPNGRTRLHELVAHVRETIRVATREGQTEARITLHPAELGEVRIRLSYTPAGITATISAESTRAAQALAESSPELRRTLEEHGVALQALDVQVGSDGPRTGSGPDPGSWSTTGDSPRESGGNPDEPADQLQNDDPTTSPAGAPLGALVDVLA
jgi:flagellar hook-length control protein FliK